MTLRIQPIVGASGYYSLAAPFDVLVVDAVEYTCQGIRRISDCLANNEDVAATIYKANGIADAIYDEDLAENSYIISLQSRTGHWLYVPDRYILSYPSPNGIPYRSMMIGLSLPSLPAAQSLTALMTDVKGLVEARLGVTIAARLVETSKVVLIPVDDHTRTQTTREIKKAGENSFFASNVRLRRENDLLLAKVTALEKYITEHATP